MHCLHGSTGRRIGHTHSHTHTHTHLRPKHTGGGRHSPRRAASSPLLLLPLLLLLLLLGAGCGKNQANKKRRHAREERERERERLPQAVSGRGSGGGRDGGPKSCGAVEAPNDCEFRYNCLKKYGFSVVFQLFPKSAPPAAPCPPGPCILIHLRPSHPQSTKSLEMQEIAMILLDVYRPPRLWGRIRIPNPWSL